jgi:hypothetical protein
MPIAGEVINSKRPNWEPILGRLPPDGVERFMWMHEVRLADGTHMHAYKHRETRRHLHLAENGRSFRFLSSELYGELRV